MAQSTERLTIEDTPDPRDSAFLGEQIYAFNTERTGVTDGRLLGAFVRDDAGAIVAGVNGYTWAGMLYIENLWVREDLRGQGYGARLLATAEAEGARRGATVAFLDTHSFQAPKFYQRHGYTIFATADNMPPGHQKHYLRKQLAPSDASTEAVE